MKTTVLLFVCSLAVASAAVPEWLPGRLVLVKRPYENWYESNRKNVDVRLERSSVEEVPARKTSILAYGPTARVGFSGMIENRSADKITCIVIDYKIVNLETNTPLVSKRLALAIEVFPTIKKEVSTWFVAATDVIGEQLHELFRAREQAGAKFQWSADIILVVPEKLGIIEAIDAFKIDAYVVEQKDA